MFKLKILKMYIGRFSDFFLFGIWRYRRFQIFSGYLNVYLIVIYDLSILFLWTVVSICWKRQKTRGAQFLLRIFLIIVVEQWNYIEPERCFGWCIKCFFKLFHQIIYISLIKSLSYHRFSIK
jgi:hypothetical protein